MDYQNIPLASFANRHPDATAVIVGRGPTLFDYERLADLGGPVIFLNDAVQVDRHANGVCYFFAIDKPMVKLLTPDRKAHPVLPRELEPVISDEYGESEISLTFYQCDRTPREKLLRLPREELAALDEIYNGSVTILTALHFIWFCGCTRVLFIGCDGLNHAPSLRRLGDEIHGYDRRIQNFSKTRPGWKYDRIRNAQDQVCRVLRLSTQYVGTPAVPHPNPFHSAKPLIPSIAHYVWLGGAIPDCVQANIKRFQRLHPDWDVRVWKGLPETLPANWRDLVLRLHQLCMRSDLIRIWLLALYGGFYLDGDVYPVRPFDELRHYDHFFGTEKNGAWGTNCVMGVAPGSQFVEKLKSLIDAAFRRPTPPTARTAFGPRLYTKLMRSFPGLVNPLPEHYFCLIQDHNIAFPLTRQPFPEIHRALVNRESEFADGTWPFGIHTYGIPADQLGNDEISSSWAGALGRADALLRRIGSGSVHGAEIGVADGKMSAYLLGHQPGLKMLLVDRWAPPPASSTFAESMDLKAVWSAERHQLARQHTLDATQFASDRCRYLQEESVDAARMIADASLDFVFIDAEHSYSAVKADIDAWHPKVKSGGWLGGHDYQGPSGVRWGVRQAVDEFGESSGRQVVLDENDTWFIHLP